MADYQLPSVTVEQNMEVQPSYTTREQPAFIFGPSFQLHRYEKDSEKAATRIVEDASGRAISGWTGTQITVGYPGAVDASRVDKSYTKLFGDNVVVELFDMGEASLPEKYIGSGSSSDPAADSGISIATLNANGGYTKLLFAGKAFVNVDSATGADVELVEGLERNIAAGDRVFVKYTDGDGVQHTDFAKVAAVEYRSTEWSIDSDPYSEAQAGTLVTIEDPLPLDTASVGGCSLCEVQNGVEFTRRNEAAVVGQVSPVGTYQWQEDEGVDVHTITIKALNTLVYDWDHGVAGNSSFVPVYKKVLSAELFLTFRERIDTFSDSIHTVNNPAQVRELLGVVDKDNPLAFGVHMACLNGASDDGNTYSSVYFMATPFIGDEVSEYAAVLKAATLTDKIYTLAPTTSNAKVLEVVRAHVDAMSAKNVKRWRFAAASSEIHDSEVKVDSSHRAIPVSATAGTAVSDDPNDVYTMIRIVEGFGTAIPSFRSLVKPGDIVKFGFHNDPWGDDVPDTYVVDNVVNNTTVLIRGTIDMSHVGENESGTAFVPGKVEIVHMLTPEEYAQAVASVSRHWSDRRMVNVFPTEFVCGSEFVPGYFGACAIAGRIASCEPQQPMTNLTVRGIDNVPATYRDFSMELLNVMAAGGTLIIMQDLPGDKVYIRHQITTKYSDGSLNTSELSITKNLDSISYAFADLFAPYIGKYNITDDLIYSFSSLASTLITRLCWDDSVYGPQLIAENTELLYVRQNELAADHVDIACRLGMPYPCNNIDIVLTI